MLSPSTSLRMQLSKHVLSADEGHVLSADEGHERALFQHPAGLAAPTAILAWATLFLSSMAACTSEGGVVGSGISTVSGNVAEVQIEASAATDASLAQLPPLRVSIDEAPDIADDVDAEGTFELIGDFAGSVTLRFTDRERAVDLGTLSLEVPAGSEIVLQDVRIAPLSPPPDRVRAGAIRQLRFVARVLSVDCAAGRLQVTDDAPRPHTFIVRLLPDSAILDRALLPRLCTAIRANTRITIDEGLFDLLANRQVITAIRVYLAQEPPPAEPQRRVIGEISRIDCQIGGFLVVDRRFDDEEVAVRLVPSTHIACAQTAAALPERATTTASLTCRDLLPGLTVEAQGVRRIARGQVYVEARQVWVHCGARG